MQAKVSGPTPLGNGGLQWPVCAGSGIASKINQAEWGGRLPAGGRRGEAELRLGGEETDRAACRKLRAAGSGRRRVGRGWKGSEGQRAVSFFFLDARGQFREDSRG